jgi:hypothetical protein
MSVQNLVGANGRSPLQSGRWSRLTTDNGY